MKVSVKVATAEIMTPGEPIYGHVVRIKSTDDIDPSAMTDLQDAIFCHNQVLNIVSDIFDKRSLWQRLAGTAAYYEFHLTAKRDISGEIMAMSLRALNDQYPIVEEVGK